MTTVQDLAALKALSTRPDPVTLQGYSTPGDGGGGIFYWDAGSSTTPNDGLVVQCTSGPAGRYKRLYSSAIDPRWFGAVAGPGGDNRAAMEAAINIAAGIDQIVDGAGLSYGISGICMPNSLKGLRNIGFVQLAPGTTDCRTLYITGALSDWALDDVTVDCGGDQAAGNLTDYAGIYISGDCKRFRLSNVTVTNGGPIIGLTIVDASIFELENVWVRDFTYDLDPPPEDDCIVGIGLIRCTAFSIIGGGVSKLVGAEGQPQPTRFTRGYALTGCSTFKMVGQLVDHVDQGIDITGSAGSYDFEVIGANVTDCTSNGIKLANSCHDAVVSSCLATRCGVASFMVSGMSALDIVPADYVQNIRVENCQAREAGGYAAFQVLKNDTLDDTYPRNVVIANCTAGPTVDEMHYGFQNTVAPLEYPTAGFDKPSCNTLINCTSLGHDTGVQTGFHFPLCAVRGSGSQSIPDATWTTVTWPVDVSDTSGMHNTSVTANTIFIKEAGLYAIESNLQFDTNTTGYRAARLLHNGSPTGSIDVSAVVPGSRTVCQVSYKMYLEGGHGVTLGDRVTVEVFQTSGGNLDLDVEASSFTVTRVG